MRQILAVDRMSEPELWKHLFRTLRELKDAGIGELMHRERKALATRAFECAEELHLRGHQIDFGIGQGKVKR